MKYKNSLIMIALAFAAVVYMQIKISGMAGELKEAEQHSEEEFENTPTDSSAITLENSDENDPSGSTNH